MTHPSIQDLKKVLPDAAYETSADGELVIWTGWSVDTKSPDGPLVDWCGNCKSGDDLIMGESCPECDREAENA